MSRPSVAILGCGDAVPAAVRRNDDPVFARVRREAGARGGSEHALFTGTRERRVLAPGQGLEALAADAARAALERAGTSPAEVDRLYGYLSVPEYLAPNALFRLHRDVGLAPSALVVPVNSEFSNFVTGLVLAWEAVLAGHARRCLVAVASGWTRNMDYTQGHSVSIGDGAGAAVVGPGERLVFVGHAVETVSAEYGAMAMRMAAGAERPTYAIDPDAGVGAFLTTGMEGPPRLVNDLLARHGLTGADVTLIAHQASRTLMDRWAEIVRPAAYLDTFEALGNMALASVAVTLSRRLEEVATPYLVLAGVGIGAHQVALLIRR